MEFLQRFGFGGCLADDMGLGKTVQVLALLEKRRRGESQAPSLVVVPDRWSSTGRPRRPGSRRSCACSITPASRRSAHRIISRNTI